MKNSLRPVIHHKTNKIYIFIDEIIDSTNSENDKLMILYMNMDGQLFVREKSEFWMKFDCIDSSRIKYK